MNRKTQKAAKTRARIIKAGFELFSEHGFADTGMNMIAEHAGSSRANVYLHFRNKPAIVLARMQEIEPDIVDPFHVLLDAAPHTQDSIHSWLLHMKELWSIYRVEFAAMEQAMSQDEDVAAEWLAMVRRMSLTLPGFEDDSQRMQDFVALLMGLDRNFYFLYVRGHTDNEEYVFNALSRQWLTLFER